MLRCDISGSSCQRVELLRICPAPSGKSRSPDAHITAVDSKDVIDRTVCYQVEAPGREEAIERIRVLRDSRSCR